MAINDRIRQIIDAKDWQDQEFAAKIGMSKATLSQRLQRSNWTVDELIDISEHTGYSFTWICEGSGPELEVDHFAAIEQWTNKSIITEPSPEYLTGKNIRPITVTVDQTGRDMITLVGVKAQAGYLRGYGDPHYIEKLPAFNLPILKQGAYRMFEVDGDSMLQIGGGGLHDGDIVISQYVEDILSIKDRRVYVVISTEGVCVKRCINRLKDKEHPVLICQSDNKNGQHPDLVIRAHEIIEVWELKAYISRQLGFATDIWDVLNNLESKMALMDDKIKRMDSQRLIGG